MKDLLLYALLAFAAFVLFKKLSTPKKRSQSKPPVQAPPAAGKEYKQTFPKDIPFEKQWNTGEFPCDGTKCNAKHPCSGPEKWLCRDIVSKVVPHGQFQGQFWITLPSGSRRIDFAIETLSGKRLAVELDGYNAHVESLERGDFDDQLLRQNELVCSGWTVLRFSFDQLRKHAEQCRKQLQEAVSDEYMAFNKTPVLTGRCLTADCTGTAKRLKSKEGKFFWKCYTCKSTFDNDKITPSPKE